MKRASETFFPTTTATAATAAAAAAATQWKRGVAASGRLSARAVALRRFAFGSKEARNIKSLFEAPLDAEQRGTGEARQYSELQYPVCTLLPGRKTRVEQERFPSVGLSLGRLVLFFFLRLA